MSKHTPGPWTFSSDGQFGETRFYIAQAEGAPYTPNYSDVATLIAETVGAEYVLIQKANARLIAAAPDLLEALQRFLDYESAMDSREDVSGMLIYAGFSDMARAAIAKATGGQP